MRKKKRKLKPEITKQNILEKLAEVYLSFGEFRFALPWIFMMASVIILIHLQGWLIPPELLPKIMIVIFALDDFRHFYIGFRYYTGYYFLLYREKTDRGLFYSLLQLTADAATMTLCKTVFPLKSIVCWTSRSKH